MCKAVFVGANELLRFWGGGGARWRVRGRSLCECGGRKAEGLGLVCRLAEGAY